MTETVRLLVKEGYRSPVLTIRYRISFANILRNMLVAKEKKKRICLAYPSISFTGFPVQAYIMHLIFLRTGNLLPLAGYQLMVPKDKECLNFPVSRC